MDSNQSSTKRENDGVKIGEWVRHLTKSGRDYFYNVKSYAVQLEKPREWLEYEKQHGPVPSQSSQSSSTTTSNTPSSSLHRQQYQSHQPSSSSSNNTDCSPRSNTISSDEVAEFLQQHGSFSSLQISGLHMPQSPVPSSSHQLESKNIGHELGHLGQQQSEDQNSEDMDISVSALKFSDSDSPTKIWTSKVKPYETIEVKDQEIEDDDDDATEINEFTSLIPCNLNWDTESTHSDSDLDSEDMYISFKETASLQHHHDHHQQEHNILSPSDLCRDEEMDREDKNRAPEKRKSNFMDSHQSSSKELGSNINSLQNQGTLAITTEEGEIVMAKRRKEETGLLQMRKVLAIIFSFLDANSIKNARQVNPLWSVEGAKVLFAKCYVQIPRDVQIKDMDSSEMSEFEAFLSLKSSDCSAIPNITIKNYGDFNVWNSLGVLGPQVKAVKMKIIDPEARLLLKLLNVLPNLKYLNFRDLVFYDDQNRTIIKLLKSVMSRKEKDGTTLVISHMFLEADNAVKLEEVKNFLWCTNIMMEEIKLFFSPSLTKTVPNLEVQLVNIMSKLLSTSQNILKRLTIDNCQLFLSLLEFPCMTSLTRMDLDFWPKTSDQLPHCKFSPSFRFLEKVPNLREICISFRNFHRILLSQSFLQHLFKDSGPAPSVKRVTYLRDYTDFDCGFLFKMFPNVEDLQTCVNCCSHTWFFSLWILGRNLRKLRLHFDLDQLLGNDFDLDSVFTGFTPETIEEIKMAPNLKPCSLEKSEYLRGKPSILNLKELEQITIDLDCHDRNVLTKGMLTIAEKCAFRLLPKRPMITINVDDGDSKDVYNAAMEALDEVSQFANVSIKRKRVSWRLKMVMAIVTEEM